MNDFLFYTLAFALLLGVLIVVHELGHYAVARLVGVKVLRFSVGFGRPLALWRAGRDGTEWAIGVFPLGGYVRMLDETEGEVAPEEAHRSFNRQSTARRMAIVVAGPLANFALAVLVYWVVFLHGTEELRPVLGPPVAASAADRAGIRNGEQVLRAGGEAVETWADLRWILLRRMVEQDSIELELIDEHKETSVRHLALQEARNPEPGQDPIGVLGLRLFQPLIPAVVGRVEPDSAAAAAGLSPGDVLLAIDGRPVESWYEVVRAVRESPERPLRFAYQRDGKTLSVEITPARVLDKGREIGRIGALVADSAPTRDDLLVIVRHGPLQAFGKAIEETWEKSAFSLRMMGRMVTGALSWRHISGPVTIADYAGQSARMGLVRYLQFLALVSVSLAVLNLLPIPVLDGGHLLYYVVEAVRGRPLSDRYLMIGQKIGLTLILMLMAFALYNDFARLIPG
ncbi:MAG: RIP metalloprotease RseP [Candidatus Accumulibacter sp.]|jgi:regulator of sigma E protease|nr:RIP metalloprotease RseP [Accumulibacter sp.]